MTAIKDIDEIVECWNTSGNYDFLMKIYVKDMKHYQDFVLNTLGVIESIGRLHSNFVIGVVKSNRGIPIPE
jgi:Lrp/AsnC family leucine-responsive transcriptional regulator